MGEMMIIRNKQPQSALINGVWVRSGDTISVTRTDGEYRTQKEGHIWEEVAPVKPQSKKEVK